MQPGRRRGPAGQHLHARGGQIDEAARRIQARDDEESYQVVHPWPGGDDQEAAPGGLVGVRPGVVGVLRGGLVGRKPRDFAIPAERDGAQPVIRLSTPEAGDARAEPERIRLDSHAEEACEHQMACFVGGDEQPETDDRQEDGKHGAAVYSMHPRGAGPTFSSGRKLPEGQPCVT